MWPMWFVKIWLRYVGGLEERAVLPTTFANVFYLMKISKTGHTASLGHYGPLSLSGITFGKVWMGSPFNVKQWDVISHPHPVLLNRAIEVMAWMNNYTYTTQRIWLHFFSVTHEHCGKPTIFEQAMDETKDGAMRGPDKYG